MTDLPAGFVLDEAQSPAPPEGFVVDEQKPMSWGDTALDAYKGLGTGALKGTLALGGLLGDITNLGAKGIEKASNAVSDALGVERYKRPETPSVLNAIPTTESLTKTLKNALGEDFYHPQSTLGRTAENVGEFIPGAAATSLTGGGSLAGNMMRYAVAPGVATTVAQEALPETEYKPYLVAGAGVGASLVNPARIVTPFPATAAKQAAVDTLAREGVTSLTAGERTGNPTLKYLESAASHIPGGGGRAHEIQTEGQRQFTEAALRRAGAEGAATPEVLQATHQRLSQSFNDLAARNTLVPDNQFITDIVNSVDRYRNVPHSFERAQLQNVIDDIVPHINAGAMPGQQYQAMRHYLTETANSTQDSYFGNAMRGIRNALDNAMERSISPEDAAAWRQTREQWSAKKVLEKSASRAGEATAEGQITPANLRNTVAGENRSGYARGQGQFNDLARSGVSVMSPLPNSGTAQRSYMFHLLSSVLGGGAGGLVGGPAGAGIGATAAAVAPALASRVLMHPITQDILANQLMAGRLPVNQAARDLLLIEALQRTGNGSGITIRPQPSIESK